MSVTLAPRARIAVNAAWPGVSRKVIFWPFALDLIGADVLGDAAGLAGDHVGLADGVEQRGLAVVDVAHDGDDRRRAARGRRSSSAAWRRGLPRRRIRRRGGRCGPFPRRSAGRCRRRSRRSAFSIWPCFIRNLMTSTARSAMRLASSWTVIVSGMTTSRTIFSRGPCSSVRARSRSRRRRIEASERSRSVSSRALTSVSLPRRRSSTRLTGFGSGGRARP